jgi:hypothetical protein
MTRNNSTALPGDESIYSSFRGATGRAVLTEEMARSRAAMVGGVKFWSSKKRGTTHAAALSSVAILQEFGVV